MTIPFTLKKNVVNNYIHSLKADFKKFALQTTITSTQLSDGMFMLEIRLQDTNIYFISGIEVIHPLEELIIWLHDLNRYWLQHIIGVALHTNTV